MTTDKEAIALQNAIDHFKIPFTLVRKVYDDKRVKTKFFLVGETNSVMSPTLNYDKMNHFILGMGMAKEYCIK